LSRWQNLRHNARVAKSESLDFELAMSIDGPLITNSFQFGDQQVTLTRIKERISEYGIEVCHRHEATQSSDLCPRASLNEEADVARLNPPLGLDRPLLGNPVLGKPMGDVGFPVAGSVTLPNRMRG